MGGLLVKADWWDIDLFGPRRACESCGETSFRKVASAWHCASCGAVAIKPGAGQERAEKGAQERKA